VSWTSSSDKLVPKGVSAGYLFGAVTARQGCGTLTVLITEIQDNSIKLPTHINDNKILNDVSFLKQRQPDRKVVLVTKDTDVRLKARGWRIDSQD